MTEISRSRYFSTLNILEITQQSHSDYRTSVGSNSWCINDLQWPLTPISRSRHFRRWISQKWCLLRTECLQYTNRKPYSVYRTGWYHFQWPWVTCDPDFKVTTFLKSNIWKRHVGQSYYSTLTGNHTWHIEWYHVCWPWLITKRVARVCHHQLSFLLTMGT